MRMTEMVPTAPIQTQKSTRRDRGRVLTSGDAGKILPLKYIPMLREDAVRRGKVRVNLEMMETAELLMNGIQVNVMAHFVPMLAFDRFSGSMEELNRSYQGQVGIGGDVVPFFEKNKYWNGTSEATTTGAQWFDTTSLYPDVSAFYRTMGVHTQATDFNTTVVEAYNAIVNHRRKARSASLPLRNAYDHSLAEAFWAMENNHIVPDFDQKLIDGEVALTGLTFQAPVSGIGFAGGSGVYTNGTWIADATGATALTDSSWRKGSASSNADAVYFNSDNGLPAIFAELSQGGNATMSLADIEQAKKTAAFAKLRSMYDGIDEDYVIDLLMEGIRVPEETMKQPILLARQSTMIGYNQRYATDAANLDTSVTNGYASVDLNIRTPQMNTGGVILITAEIVPEQMWERKKDYFLYNTDADKLPNYLRDVLDPEQVAIVKNDHLDVNHSTPDGTFGYAPLNHEWQRDMVNIGGKYYRPANDAFDEDRAKIWTVETTDPTLSTDFYLVSNLHKKVFADQVADTFEITCLSDMEISGNTVFGQRLLETDATSDYEEITSLVNTARIEK
jgi:predicted Rdx family selenoprotein